MNPTNYPFQEKLSDPQIPTPKLKATREDFRHGDPHGNKTGDHPFYGPDLISLEKEEKEKPSLESHGFYLPSGESPGWWARMKDFFRAA